MYFNYRQPYQNFNRNLVRGKLVNLFTVKDLDKYGVALESVVGGRLWNVIVDNERVSKDLITNNCINYNVTYIPLNKIRGEELRDDTVRKIKELTNGKARLAIELINYDPELNPAMHFVFGSTVYLEL